MKTFRLAVVVATSVLACGTTARSSATDCGFTVTLDGGLPDGAFDGGRPYAGALPDDECTLICGTSMYSCSVIRSDPTRVQCSPGCF
jgi:hypothetical protein